MINLKYIGKDMLYPVEFSAVSTGRIVQVLGDLPECVDGFDLYRDDGLYLGNYRDYTTVYRKLDNGIQYSNDGSVYVPPEPVPEPEPYVPTLAEVQVSKKAEVSAACEQIIYAGINVTLADGSVEHYSLTIEDQLNLFGKLSQISAGVEQLEYHADGQPCRYYTAADMQTIIQAAMWHVSYHTTYCNAINIWIAGCQTVEEVYVIFYGVDVPEEYQSDVLRAYLVEIANMAAEGGGDDMQIT